MAIINKIMVFVWASAPWSGERFIVLGEHAASVFKVSELEHVGAEAIRSKNLLPLSWNNINPSFHHLCLLLAKLHQLILYNWQTFPLYNFNMQSKRFIRPEDGDTMLRRNKRTVEDNAIQISFF
jgi:hypothetical protein